MSEPVQLVTYADLAAAAGVEVATLRVWMQRGKLPAPDYRVGQSPAWLEATVADFIAASSKR